MNCNEAKGTGQHMYTILPRHCQENTKYIEKKTIERLMENPHHNDENEEEE